MPAGSRQVLKRAFSRAIGSGTLGHAYLLRGDQNAAARAFALELAAAVDCRDGPSSWACGKCSDCASTLSGHNPDVRVVEPEEGKVKLAIDQVRDLLEWMSTRSWRGLGRRAILDPADRLTEDASNCLLSLLEEPPGDTLFLLVTTQPAAILPTIRSRAMDVFVGAPDEPPATAPGSADSIAALFAELVLLAPPVGTVSAVRTFLERIREDGEPSPAPRKTLDPILVAVLDGVRAELRRISGSAPAWTPIAGTLAGWGRARLRALAERTLELRSRLPSAALPLALEAYAADVAAIRSGSARPQGPGAALAG